MSSTESSPPIGRDDEPPRQLLAQAHEQLTRIHDEAVEASRRWVVKESSRETSAEALKRLASEYGALDRVFLSLQALVTDVASAPRETSTAQHLATIAARVVVDELSRVSVDAVPLGAALRDAYEIVSKYAAFDGGTEGQLRVIDATTSALAADFNSIEILIESIVASEGRREMQRLRADLEQVTQRVGDAAASQLSFDFKALADEERKQANLFRYLATSALIVALGITVYVALSEATFSWQEQIWKIAVDLPLILMAYYFSSESRDHRLNARRAKEIEVRLNTIRAYTDDMNPSDREAIRVAMGQAIFREPSMLGMGDTVADAATSLSKQISDVLATRKNES